MSAPITVSRVIEKLSSRFLPDNAKDLSVTYQFMLEDAEDFYFTIANQTLEVVRGEHQDPNITLILNSETFIRVVTGEQDGMSAFLKGQLRAEGKRIAGHQTEQILQQRASALTLTDKLINQLSSDRKSRRNGCVFQLTVVKPLSINNFRRVRYDLTTDHSQQKSPA